MAGYGDEIIATGLARGAQLRGKRIAFGEKGRILWGPHSAEIFKGNPNIAPPGSELDLDIEWLKYFKGHRIYNRHRGNNWEWNYSFRPKPGEVFLDETERAYAATIDAGFVLIEPNVPWHKLAAVNKDWGLANYQAVAATLGAMGYEIAQFAVGRDRLKGVKVLSPPTFRHALAALERAALVITPEGGLHHGAAAVGARAVVMFGGWIAPEATGYSMHSNITASSPACGLLKPCPHCRRAMREIKVERVMAAAIEILRPHG